MANLPNTAADRTNLEKIYGHIASLTVQGLARPFDVMAMIETDTQSAVESANAANAVFPTSLYQSSVTAADGGSDRTGFLFNARTVSLLDTQDMSVGLTHNILRGHFRPAGTAGDTDFYYYAVHMKSGATSTDHAARVSEAQTLRANADALGSAAIIFGGDFNWSGSDELGPNPAISAWDVFSAPGAAQSFDPVNAIGNWRDNTSYLSLHTNDPGAAMDDRFDMQLITSELTDRAGLEYIAGSYKVVGNNGTHQLNGPITTGTGAPADILSALANFSDHLPVFAEYSYSAVTPEPTTLAAVCGAILLLRRTGGRRAI